MAKTKRTLTLKTLTKGNVWELAENDVIRLWQAGLKDPEFRENEAHYRNIITTAFELDKVMTGVPGVVKKFKDRGFKIGQSWIDETRKYKLGVKKRPIVRVSDLTYQNIRHITAAKLLEVIDRNFGGGWESLSQSIKDIILTNFFISTTTLPKERLKKAGGMYEKMVKDHYAVLEIEKGAWVEAIFAKAKPVIEKGEMPEEPEPKPLDDTEEELVPENDYTDTEEDDEYDDERLTEESYRTTIETSEEDLSLADQVADEYDVDDE